jgi:hypothetical protein
MMSKTAEILFASLNAARELVLDVAPGLRNFVPEVKSEFSRLGTQGAMEAAAILFHDNDAFVPYGPGAYSSEPAYDVAQEQDHMQEHDIGCER